MPEAASPLPVAVNLRGGAIETPRRSAAAPSGADALHKLIGRSPAMQQVRDLIQRFAGSNAPVLILGETGTGKDLCAEAIALLSGRRPFVPVNCAAIPENLVESELFGHEAGAFTGATRARDGLIAAADGGVLFLDELAELACPMQAKLLRAVGTGEYYRLGSTQPRWSHFRILAATSGDVDGGVAAGRLRADLMYRVSAGQLWMPPLRERLEDIPVLAEEFVRQTCKTGPLGISTEACVVLMQQEWPGNVRQLRNVVEVAAAWAGSEPVIGVLHVAQALMPPGKNGWAIQRVPTLVQVRQRAEERAVLESLLLAGGNRERAAELLGISEATLYRKLGKGRLQIRESTAVGDSQV